jgi:diguanylate cyclase (GGDEF)-like protein/PAS domain S-box-containing protein
MEERAMLQDTVKNNTAGDGLHHTHAYDETLLKSLTDHLPVVLYQFLKHPDTNGIFLYVSNAVADIFEVTPAELLSDSEALIKRVYPDDVAHVKASIDEAIRTLCIWDCQFRVMLPGKGIRWVRDVARPEKLEDGSVLSHGYWEDITEKKKTDDWISYLNTALMNISESIIITDMESKIIYANQKVKELHGYDINEIIGKPADMMNVDPMSESQLAALVEALDEGRTYSGTARSRRKDDSIFLCEFSLTPIRGDDQATCIGVQRDITERTQMIKALAESNERYKATLLSVGEGIISTDCDGRITVMNPLAERMTGWPRQEAVGSPLTQVLRVFDEQTGKVLVNPAEVVLETTEVYQPGFPTVLASKLGKEIPVEIIAAPIKNSTGEISGVVIVLKDFSEYRERQQQIEYLSYHDFLTGLYNRRFLEKAINDMDTRTNQPLTVMIVDVNGLKLTNDAFGHATGDRLLRTVADILRIACRSGDIIARYGGDEFAILLPQTDAVTAEKIKQRILQAAMKTKLDTVVVSLAIGYSVKTSMLDSIENVLMSADKLMYKDKFNQGKTMRNETIDTVLKNINAKFEQEQTHTQRVSQYCSLISSAIGLSQKEKSEIQIAGLLHDIGKIMIPSDLLNKPEKLTDEEFDIIKRHPETGYQILKSVDEYITIAKYVLHHHERWDGTGYPAGLRGEGIPLQSRIIAVADAYEAMTARRVYQKTRTAPEAKEELERCSGTQFDPEIVKIFLESVLNES